MPSSKCWHTTLHDNESPCLGELIFLGNDEKVENNKDVSCQADGSAMECPVTEGREEQTESSSVKLVRRQQQKWIT